ncbi:MAG: recombinase family protein [Rhodothermaceae bacterium]|nr:recombinase family protein [Rhodothermaceae bacterium]MYG70483.1 recombinase family protein [Rhodothermaceae bacterium]MYJ43976.1 recombinase family protein [Rhodothermaceae bacterium]
MNKESQYRQYDLRLRALALGWPEDRIDIIDEDQGKSGASTAQRTGFQDLRARVGAAEVGIILSLEVSRLCRNNAEWHQLLRIAEVSDTLILDEHGIYDARDLNDWMGMGIKGQLSEYELRNIRARMIGGQRSKARRGELKLPLPIGLVYTATDQVILDPDQSIREAIELVFRTFRRLQSAMQVTKWFRRKGIRLPSRPRTGSRALCWSVPTYSQIQRILRNPRYAGCYAYGRTKCRQRADGSMQFAKLPMDQWMVCIPEAHPGYIFWEEYQQNRKTLQANAASFLQGDRVPSPRKGTALLHSRIICGISGHRMQVSYTSRKDRPLEPKWYYLCKENRVRRGTCTCQSMRGDVLDAAVGTFVVAAVNRENLALSLMVREQVRTDFEVADRQRKHHIEALRHQVELARRRFMELDPSNRLVASTLEADWEAQLKLHEAAV